MLVLNCQTLLTCLRLLLRSFGVLIFLATALATYLHLLILLSLLITLVIALLTQDVVNLQGEDEKDEEDTTVLTG